MPDSGALSILHVDLSKDFGGSERYCLDIAERQIAAANARIGAATADLFPKFALVATTGLCAGARGAPPSSGVPVGDPRDPGSCWGPARSGFRHTRARPRW